MYPCKTYQKDEGFFSYLKSLRQSLAVGRILSAYTLSNIIHFPKGDRFQANINTFIRCLSMPENPIGNVLIIQGGARHMDSNSYYIRTACSFMSRKVRVFVFEKLLPVINFEFAHDISDCLKYIKKHFPGPTCVIGYSMGGILLWSYLALGYDQADLYIPSCCPLNLHSFSEIISTHPLFRLIQNKTYKCFQVDGYQQLLEFSGTTVEQHEEFMNKFIPMLNSQKDKWLNKVIYVLSEDDPVTKLEDLKLLEKGPLTYLVKGGWHCCLNSTFLTVLLASRFIESISNGESLKVEEIPII